MLKKHPCKIVALCTALVLAASLTACTSGEANQPSSSQTSQTEQEALATAHDSVNFVMDTILTQTVYGPNATGAMNAISQRLSEFEDRLSLYVEAGDIGRINAAAGKEAVSVDATTYDLLQRAVALSAQSENTFAITIAPLTLAWGVTSDSPRIVPEEELNELLPLVNDSAILFGADANALSESLGGPVVEEATAVMLPTEGMALDLGGIAKGEAVRIALEVFEEYGITSALFNLGGSSIYAHGTKADGSPWRIGFRDPSAAESGYMASFTMVDEIIAVSGGYERFFEVDGETFIHIIDPVTGTPPETDIATIGVFGSDGAETDFWSTTLFVLGVEKALEHMQNGMACIVVDTDDNVYVSQSLEGSFELYGEAVDTYTLTFIAGS